MVIRSVEMVATDIASRLVAMPRDWDGKACITDMRQSGSNHWRQMEWIGWYFEFLCHRLLTGTLQMPGPRYGRVGFDGFGTIPWDFKSHASDGPGDVIINDSRAIRAAIEQYGAVGLILAQGTARYDNEENSFRNWHEEIKGGKSAYTLEREARGSWSRRRKAAFKVSDVAVIRFTADTLAKCRSFQTGFRNADGSPRAAKVRLNPACLTKEVLARSIPHA